MDIIQFINVGEKFRLYHQKNRSLKDRFLDLIKARKTSREEFWALKGVSFGVRKGEVVGIIGENGSGKTTILSLIAGILKPDEGEVKIQGRVSALLELGIGFHPDLSGRENVYLYGALLGLSQKEIDEKLDEIIRFAELEKFIDAPIKTYSAGMYVRLGFAVAINVDPDILLIDEVLAVGDASFQGKCIKKINEFKEKGKTIVVVSHDMHLIGALCNRAILLKDGNVVTERDAGGSIELYQEIIGDKRGVGVLEGGALKLIFNNGRIILLWDGKMLSKGLGGYTSLLSYGRWHESVSATWQCTDITPSKIIAVGNWGYLPITQVWRIELKEGNVINWAIDIQIHGKTYFQNDQVNIMLSEKYNNWSARSDTYNLLPDRFNPPGLPWQTVWQQDASATPSIGIIKDKQDEKELLPSISFHCDYEKDKYTAKIINSDSLYKARVLRYVKNNENNNNEFHPCKYRYFEGRIQINSI